MNNLKKVLITLLLLSFTTTTACGSDSQFSSRKKNSDSQTDKNNTNNPKNDNNNNNNTPPPPTQSGVDGSLVISELDDTQFQAMCQTQVEKRRVFTPSSNAGKGLCTLIAYFETEERFMANQGSPLDICIEELDNCITNFNPSMLTIPCVVPEALPTCEATVQEFEACAADRIAHEIALGEAFHNALQGKACTKLFDDEGPIDSDILYGDDMPNLFDEPASCEQLKQKCPGFDHAD